MRKMG
jgi:cyclin-dependent kinase 12/13